MGGDMGRGAYLRRVSWFFFVLAVLLVSAHPVSAQFYVRSPDVENGEFKLEEHGAVYSGPGEDERRRQSHELEAKYGFTDRFEGIVELTARENIGDSLKWHRFELGGQYELVERHGDGLGLAFRSLYEFALQDGDPDEILFGPLAKYVWRQDSFTINTFFIGQVGNHVDIDSLELKANWRLKHEFNETWGVGVEGYSEVEDLAHTGTWDDQKHRVGPVAYLELEGMPKWEFAAGTLFGVSDATSDITFKFDIEAEF
ncbi:MAG TPA: hypothetical protein VMW05_00955 [Methyloceanibacter sp.]|nr:hypothetical protein [Methyloceanibacter sp.]